MMRERRSGLQEVSIPWISAVPDYWQQTQFRSVFSQKRLKNKGLIEENVLSLSYGSIVRRDIQSSDGLVPDSYETYQIVDVDDIVFRFTDLQNDKRSLRSGLVPERGIITSAYVAAKPTGIHPGYASYLMRSYDLAKVFYALGGGVRQTLKFSDVATLPVLSPPLDEQKAIADYLDREMQKIDELIAEQHGLVDALRERRESLSQEVFGISEGTTIPLKWLADEITVGIVVTPAKWYEYEGEGIPALRGANVKRGYIDTSTLVHLSQEGDRLHRKSRLKADDVIVVRTGQAGAAAVVPNALEGFNAIDLLIIRPNSSLDSGFLESFLNSHAAAAQISERSVGAIQGHFNVASLRELRIPDVELETQLKLSGQWKAASSSIDELISESEDLISLSQERRAALITAAVTGQIDVRTTS